MMMLDHMMCGLGWSLVGLMSAHGVLKFLHHRRIEASLTNSEKNQLAECERMLAYAEFRGPRQ